MTQYLSGVQSVSDGLSVGNSDALLRVLATEEVFVDNDYKVFKNYVSDNSWILIRENNNERLENIHILPVSHPKKLEMLQSKEYYLAHPEIIEEYSNLKLDLFKKFQNDYAKYRELKDMWLNKFRKEKIEPWIKLQNRN